jgi:large subunit ribosomal protein L4
MVAIQIVDMQGAKVREVEVDLDQLDSSVRRPLLKEALIAYLASQRQGSHSTKTRGEVAGGKHKPYRQKGTGRARQGSIRAPQFVGGGRAHGPRPRDYHYRLPRQQRRLATMSSLRYRAEQGRLVAVEGLEAMDKPRTKDVVALLQGLGLAGKGALLVSESNVKPLYLSARNIQKIDVLERRNLCAGQVLRRPNLILSAQALSQLIEEVSA